MPGKLKNYLTQKGIEFEQSDNDIEIRHHSGIISLRYFLLSTSKPKSEPGHYDITVCFAAKNSFNYEHIQMQNMAHSAAIASLNGSAESPFKTIVRGPTDFGKICKLIKLIEKYEEAYKKAEKTPRAQQIDADFSRVY